MSDPTRAAAVYCRISNDPTGTGLGVTRQRDDCESHATALGWPVAGFYEDNDVSAYSGKKRPAYERLVDDLREGRIDAVIAWHPDRLHRSPRELEDFIDLIETTGAAVSTVSAGIWDLSSPEGRAFARILGAMARQESEHKSRRAKRKHEELALAGKGSGGGTRPFGFEEDRVTIRESEAVVIRSAVERILAGGTLRGQCKQWNDQGVATVKGGRWTPHVLKRLLTSARLAGWREHKGEMVAEAEWEGIIDVGTLERLRRILNDPARLTRHYARNYLLTGGLARCALCGANLVARPRGDHRRSYVCASDLGGCGKIRSLADPLEEALVEMVIQVLDGPAVWQALRRAEEGDQADGELVSQIRADEEKIEELTTDYYVDGAIPKAAFLSARDQLEARLSENRAKLGHREGSRALEALEGRTGDLRDTWAGLPFDNQRAIVATVLDHIDVGPAIKGQNFFNPARLVPVWRY